MIFRVLLLKLIFIQQQSLSMEIYDLSLPKNVVYTILFYSIYTRSHNPQHAKFFIGSRLVPVYFNISVF